MLIIQENSTETLKEMSSVNWLTELTELLQAGTVIRHPGQLNLAVPPWIGA